MKSYIFFLLWVLLSISCSRALQKDAPGYKFEPAETLFLAKHFPSKVPDFVAMEEAHQLALRKVNAGQRTNGEWKLEGPANIGARINAIAMHPVDANIIYAGFADGGLWKTTDGGVNWLPIFDQQIWQSIGSICIDPVNPDNIYVGTGDPNVSGYPRAGGGVYKSTDAGATWKNVGLQDTRIISRILVHKNKPNTVYVAAMGTPFFKNSDKGVYRSQDGGNTWNQVLFVNDSTGISEIIIHPENEQILYAVGWNRVRNYKKSLVSGPDARVYKTTDGGNNWVALTNGLPQGNFTRMGLCLAPNNPDVIYVQYTDAQTLNLAAIYKSSDGGNSFVLHTDGNQSGLPGSALGGFGWYFGKIRVNPSNENDLFLLGVGLYRYDPVSESWNTVLDDDAAKNPHADKHDLIFRGNDMYLATDGGLYKGKLSGNPDWQDIENIPATQFYRTAVNPHRPEIFYGGAQDNGTSSGNGSNLSGWERIWGGDGFQMAFRPDNEDVMYVETQNGSIAVTQDGGNAWDGATDGLSGSRHWDMQYIISQHNPDVLYTGTDKFYQSVSGIVPAWNAISGDLVDKSSDALIHQFTTLAESPLDPGVLYCGTSDAMVWNTRDGGINWNRITNGLPSRYISSIKASPSLLSTVYVTQTGYKDNDNVAHIYRSDDYGASWLPISGNLPPYAINDVVILPNGSDNVIFVATDGGVYITTNAGANWERLGNNMPLIPVFDMDYDGQNNKLVAATFARGIQSFLLDQIGVGLETGVKEATLLWAVYPALVKQQLEFKGEAPPNIELWDIKGKRIGQYQQNGTLDVSFLNPGIYFVKGGSHTQKIVKI